MATSSTGESLDLPFLARTQPGLVYLLPDPGTPRLSESRSRNGGRGGTTGGSSPLVQAPAGVVNE